MPKGKRRYTAKLKFQAVLESLTGEKTPGQIAKACAVHPNSIGIWKMQLLERGAEIFDRAEPGDDVEKRIAEFEFQTALVSACCAKD